MGNHVSAYENIQHSTKAEPLEVEINKNVTNNSLNTKGEILNKTILDNGSKISVKPIEISNTIHVIKNNCKMMEDLTNNIF